MSRSFSAILAELDHGRVHDELTEKLADLADAVRDTRKAGTVTLTLTVKPNGERSVEITDSIKAKLPEGDKAKSLFFVDEHGNLSRRDPRQMEMPLRDVEAHARQEVRAID
ncbi:hypothetical protein [Rhodoligotrophos ferricapiens]|uniref:hypothetical protein n=1 Tax=Rhodoligotrophos ferricapiens TaxID=3069264 RepID=UPI00315CD0D9